MDRGRIENVGNGRGGSVAPPGRSPWIQSPLTSQHVAPHVLKVSTCAALKTSDTRDYNHRTLSLLSPPLRPPCLQKFSVPDCLA